jgi:hypothetical protein
MEFEKIWTSAYQVHRFVNWQISYAIAIFIVIFYFVMGFFILFYTFQPAVYNNIV